jgi:pentatricopeptide repeat protein
LEADLITFNTLLHGFYAKGRFVDGERIWEQMKEKNVEPDKRSYNLKLLGLTLEKRMEDAVKVVEEMKSEGIQLDTFSYSALIRGFVNEGDLKNAKHWYLEIGKSGCKRDKLTLEGLIPFALQKGDFMFAYGICKYVLCSKLPVQNALIQSVVDALAKDSRLEEAKKLVGLGESCRAHSYKLELPKPPSNPMTYLVSVFHRV